MVINWYILIAHNLAARTPYTAHMRYLPILPALLLCLSGMAQTEDPRPGLPPNSSSMEGHTGPVQVVDDNDPFVPNSFVGSFRMEMHARGSGEQAAEAPMNMHYWSSPDMTLITMASEGAGSGPQTGIQILNDLKNKWTYILMTDPKGNKTAMKSRKKKYIVDEGLKDKYSGTFTVTKESKLIDGHKCTKVIATTGNGTWTGWVAKDIAIPFGDIANNMSRGAMQQGWQNWEGLKGFPLEYEMADKDGKQVMQVVVKDLQIGAVDPAIFSISDYKVMEVPGVHRAP